MKSVLITAGIWLILVAGPAFSQTVHLEKLRGFQGLVQANLTKKSRQLTSSSFIEWTFHPVNRMVNRDPDKTWWGIESYLWLGYRPNQAPLYEVPSIGLAIVPLQDLVGFERQNHVLSFWAVKGDSLEFQFFNPQVYPGGIGDLTVRDVLDLGKGNLLLVTEVYSTDHGVFGQLSFSTCNLDSKRVCEVHKARYSSIAGAATGDTLRYELVETAQQVNACLIRQQLLYSKGEKTQFGYERIREVAKTDTLEIKLSPKYW